MEKTVPTKPQAVCIAMLRMELNSYHITAMDVTSEKKSNPCTPIQITNAHWKDFRDLLPIQQLVGRRRPRPGGMKDWGIEILKWLNNVFQDDHLQPEAVGFIIECIQAHQMYPSMVFKQHTKEKIIPVLITRFLDGDKEDSTKRLMSFLLQQLLERVW